MQFYKISGLPISRRGLNEFLKIILVELYLDSGLFQKSFGYFQEDLFNETPLRISRRTHSIPAWHTSKPSSRVSVNLRPLWSYLIAYTQGQKVSTPLLINSVWGSSYQNLCFTYKTILRMRVILTYHISKYDAVKILRHSSTV